MAYDRIDPGQVAETLDVLCRRIGERFPQSGLHEVCKALVEIARKSRKRTRGLARPFYMLRTLQAGFAGLAVAAVIWTLDSVGLPLAFDAGAAPLSMVEGVEALINILLILGAGAFFVFTAEERIKRRRALDDLHRLRSVAHVIDMHQLTKDPAAILAKGPRTASSPPRDMTQFELTRYLDYCTEMLSMVGKLAALYAEASNDPVIVSAAGDIERMTTNLASKIWQKIMTIGDARMVMA